MWSPAKCWRLINHMEEGKIKSVLKNICDWKTEHKIQLTQFLFCVAFKSYWDIWCDISSASSGGYSGWKKTKNPQQPLFLHSLSVSDVPSLLFRGRLLSGREHIETERDTKPFSVMLNYISARALKFSGESRVVWLKWTREFYKVFKSWMSHLSKIIRETQHMKQRLIRQCWDPVSTQARGTWATETCK